MVTLPIAVSAATSAAVHARHARGQSVRLTDEMRHVEASGPAVDFPWRADLPDLAVLHDRKHVGERHRFFLVMGDVDAGKTPVVLHLPDFLAQPLADLRIDVGQRLVEQKRRRRGDERARKRDALLLATAQLARIAGTEPRRRPSSRASRRRVRQSPRASARAGCAADRRRFRTRSYAATARTTETSCRGCDARAAG